MTFAAAVGPLVVYAATFQTIVFFLLPARIRAGWAPVTIGLVGAGLTLTAGAVFGFGTIGLGAPDPATVAIWAIVSFVVVSWIGVTMLWSDRLRPALADPRIAGLGRRGAVFQIAFRIPILTALIEEAFFRGVLHAALTAVYSTPVAILVGGGLFGLWHLGPALEQSENHLGDSSTTVHVLATIAVTTLAGFGFVALRIATGSIWVPVVVHALLNITMALFARVAGGPRFAGLTRINEDPVTTRQG
ncbi:MAG: type II CAAX endopeptidase family protein [Acidimicrobiia bacterium]